VRSDGKGLERKGRDGWGGVMVYFYGIQVERMFPNERTDLRTDVQQSKAGAEKGEQCAMYCSGIGTERGVVHLRVRESEWCVVFLSVRVRVR
jgi:hypothetical protein